VEPDGGARPVLSATVLTTIRTVPETGSTNADLLAIAANAEEGLWLRTERQTAGRGRQGRVWVEAGGNLYASTVVKLRPSDPPAPTLAFVAAVALEEAVALFLREGAALALKWPNDLLLGGGKLSGILLERAGDTIVIGFGVNLAHHPDIADRAVTSLAAHGPAPDAATFLDALAEIFARWLSRWRGEGFGPVRERWLDRAHAPGTALSVRQDGDVALEGLFDGIDREGALILRLADGSRRVMHAGDVFLI
jgi:BirA family transcriptional regulator, biotin operon repressor / biotin---[acetyl-CoA-carboxylase] ligase